MIQLLFFALSAFYYAIFWTLQFHYESSIFSTLPQKWWNPEISWKNKWLDGVESKGEAFWGSSRWFVFITDAFHFFQSIFLWCITFAIINFNPVITPTILGWLNLSSLISTPFQCVIDMVIIKGVFSVIFQLCFGIIFNKK